jgi:hypothetical protein
MGELVPYTGLVGGGNLVVVADECTIGPSTGVVVVGVREATCSCQERIMMVAWMGACMMGQSGGDRGDGTTSATWSGSHGLESDKERTATHLCSFRKGVDVRSLLVGCVCACATGIAIRKGGEGHSVAVAAAAERVRPFSAAQSGAGRSPPAPSPVAKAVMRAQHDGARL